MVKFTILVQRKCYCNIGNSQLFIEGVVCLWCPKYNRQDVLAQQEEVYKELGIKLGVS